MRKKRAPTTLKRSVLQSAPSTLRPDLTGFRPGGEESTGRAPEVFDSRAQVAALAEY